MASFRSARRASSLSQLCHALSVISATFGAGEAPPRCAMEGAEGGAAAEEETTPSLSFKKSIWKAETSEAYGAWEQHHMCISPWLDAR